MGSRQSLAFATPHSRVPSAMIGQYILKPDTHSNRDTGTRYSSIIKRCPGSVFLFRPGNFTQRDFSNNYLCGLRLRVRIRVEVRVCIRVRVRVGVRVRVRVSKVLGSG